MNGFYIDNIYLECFFPHYLVGVAVQWETLFLISFSVPWTGLTAPAAGMLQRATFWFFTRNFTLDPRNVHSYGLGRQMLSLWNVCFNEFIYSFKFHLPRKNVIDVQTACQQEIRSRNFLLIFVLLILQEMSVSLFAPFCEVMSWSLAPLWCLVFFIWRI